MMCIVSSAKRSTLGFKLKFKCISLYCADFHCKGIQIIHFSAISDGFHSKIH